MRKQMDREQWLLLQQGAGSAYWNMALDEALLLCVAELGSPILRLYGWSEPAASFGYFQRYDEVAGWTTLRPLVRRPTGGGLVPHDADWTYSIVIPPSHRWHKVKAEQSYQQAHGWIAESLARLALRPELASVPAKEAPGRCFIGAEKFDVISEGKKVAGAAQRRNHHGLLIQGSIQPPTGLNRAGWEAALLEHGQQRLGIAWQRVELPEKVGELASVLLKEKYFRPEYNHKK
jgi:lipoate-protein ligase A